MIREFLAGVTDEPLTTDTALLSGGLGLDSVTVVRLLAAIKESTGVDVADLDLDLASLATVGSLESFVTEHRGNP